MLTPNKIVGTSIALKGFSGFSQKPRYQFNAVASLFSFINSVSNILICCSVVPDDLRNLRPALDIFLNIKVRAKWEAEKLQNNKILVVDWYLSRLLKKQLDGVRKLKVRC